MLVEEAAGLRRRSAAMLLVEPMSREVALLVFLSVKDASVDHGRAYTADTDTSSLSHTPFFLVSEKRPGLRVMIQWCA